MNGGCGRCFHLQACGGLEGALYLWGCHFMSHKECADRQLTCFECRSPEAARRFAEVGGWPPPAAARMRSLSGNIHLPSYVPRLEHASGVAGTMRLPVVALPTSTIFRGRGDAFAVRFETAAALRRTFHIARNTAVILITVAADSFLERLWKYHRDKDIPSHLARLGIAAITIPNFSYFSDVQRPHTLLNQGRIDRCIERFSAAGVAVIPHLNALTEYDWRHWRDLLRRFPDARFIVKEFQTHDGDADLDRLAKLQDELARPIHPILVGAGDYATRVGKLFARSTLVSSTPFFKAVKGRQRAQIVGDTMRWTESRVPNGAPLRELVEHNAMEYARYMELRLSARAPRQLDLFALVGRVVATSVQARKQTHSRTLMLPVIGDAQD